MIKKTLLSLAILLAILATSFLCLAWYIGAWNILFPSSHHETVPPDLPSNITPPSVLLFSKTNSFRHKEGIAAGQQTFKEIAKRRGVSLYSTENGAIFNESDLQRFDVVVFLHATGDMLSADQERAFERWLAAGGGWLGVHAAGDGSHAGWRWYLNNLIGANFTAHILGPNFQTATVTTEASDHALNAGLPATWQAEEEWYSWASSPREQGFRVMASVDESTYTPVQKLLGSERDLRMGDHPIAWINCIGEGRSFYTALGHQAKAFQNPHFERQLENALVWLAGNEACPGLPE